MSRPRLWLSGVVAVLVGAGIFVTVRSAPATPEVTRLVVSRGDVVENAVATGTLAATRTVDVGTDVSGTIQKLYVDFNSLVTRGQVIARLDPAPAQAALESAKAARDQVTIDLTQDQSTLEYDERLLVRDDQMFQDSLISPQDHDAAALQVKGDESQIDSDHHSEVAADAAVTRAEIDLAHCTVTSPVDGVVIARNVDEGQTVASRAAAPTLFQIATDLHTLQLIGDVDESDVPRLRPGQEASFTVGAYPTLTFGGRVRSVRLNSTTVNRVVTYQVIIDVANPDLRLLPGMTPSFTVATARASQVLRVPNQALRYRPTPDVLAAYGATAPRAAAAAKAAGPAEPPANAPGATDRSAATARALETASTIDSAFQPVTRPTTPAEVWVLDGTTLKAVPIAVGVTDGRWTELVSGDLTDGESLITNIVLSRGTSSAKH